MIVPLFASLVTTLFGLALALTATFLILLVLVQRGRGGGLAGALGGMGGTSAFGAKAGDIFTRITIGVAAVWIVLCMAAVKFSGPTSNLIDMPVNQGASSSANDSTNPSQDSGSLDSSSPAGSSLEDKEPQKTDDTTTEGAATEGTATEGTGGNPNPSDQASTAESTSLDLSGQEPASSSENATSVPSDSQSPK